MNIIDKIKLQGQTLADLRSDIQRLEVEQKLKLGEIKEQRDKVQLALIESLTKGGITSVKVKSGDSFILQSRKSVMVTNALFADQWALKNGCVTLNKTMVGQRLKEMPESKWPRGLTMEDKQFISVKKAVNKGTQKITPDIEEKMLNPKGKGK